MRCFVQNGRLNDTQNLPLSSAHTIGDANPCDFKKSCSCLWLICRLEILTPLFRVCLEEIIIIVCEEILEPLFFNTGSLYTKLFLEVLDHQALRAAEDPGGRD